MKIGLKLERKALTPEQETLFNRLVLLEAAGALTYYFSLNPLLTASFFTFLCFAFILILMERFGIWKIEERLFGAIILDAMMGFSVMLREPALMAWVYPLFLWEILGTGFRFGVKWLFLASGLLTVSFGVVVATTPYWHQHQMLGYSLTAALLVIPAYCSTLIRKISHAKEQAEIASRAKSYFLAGVSHELRTPLNAIIGYGNHLRQLDMPRSQKEMIDASVLAGEHLLHLIEQLIQVSKTGSTAATVKKTKLRITDLLTEIRDIMAVRAEEKGLTLMLQATPLSDQLVEGPEDVVRNILLNLTGNAIKFTESGSVAISGGLNLSSKAPHLWLSVSDTGIGIAEDAVDKIFQPFQQADDTVLNRFGGTGLGLAICKQLVEQVGGTIRVESMIGKGSTFHITVPVESVTLEEEAQPSLTNENGNLVQIISFGQIEPELLAGTQSAGNFAVMHVECQNSAELVEQVFKADLSRFNVAMIAQHLVSGLDSDHIIWQKFSDAEVAPVLVSARDVQQLEDLSLRAAFATVLSPNPNFAELRSAIRIGCSFARQIKLPSTTDNVETEPLEITSRSVLVADDNRTNRNVLGAILEAAGHRVTMVTDGDEALDALEQGDFDILLLDVNMPRLNGIDACRMWRQMEGGRQHLPIVGVTADATAETEKLCLKAGMDLRITKPVNAKLLLNTIENICRVDAPPISASNAGVVDPLNVVVSLNRSDKPSLSAIDADQLSYLWSIGDRKFVQGMIEGFFEDIDQTIGSMRQSVENMNVQEFRFCAHAFKSAANNMGATSLAALCAKLEKITEGDFSNKGVFYLGKIERELERVSAELQSPEILERPVTTSAA